MGSPRFIDGTSYRLGVGGAKRRSYSSASNSRAVAWKRLLRHRSVNRTYPPSVGARRILER
jgi:hypothetical protein